MSGETFEAMQSAGKVLTLMLFLVGVATSWRFISFFVGGDEMGRTAADSLLSGPLSMNFWIFEVVVGFLMPLAILVASRMKSSQAMATAGLLTLVGQFFSRYDLVVAGQQVPVFLGWDNLPTYMAYTPTVAEILVVMGGIGLTGAGFLMGERFFGRAFRHSGHH